MAAAYPVFFDCLNDLFYHNASFCDFAFFIALDQLKNRVSGSAWKDGTIKLWRNQFFLPIFIEDIEEQIGSADLLDSVVKIQIWL